MDHVGARKVRSLVSLRRSSMRQHRRQVTILAAVIRLVCAGLLIWTGVIHLHLWFEGYRHIPTNGPMFLLDGLTALLLSAALVVLPRPVIGLLGAGFLVATLGALIISINVGLFGFKELLSASFVELSLVIESIAAIGLLSWAALVVAGP